jgi:hypothetical protein
MSRLLRALLVALALLATLAASAWAEVGWESVSPCALPAPVPLVAVEAACPAHTDDGALDSIVVSLFVLLH